MQNRNYKQAHEYSRLFFLYLLLAKGHQSIKFKVSGTKLKTRKKKTFKAHSLKSLNFRLRRNSQAHLRLQIHTQFTHSKRVLVSLHKTNSPLISSTLLSAGILTEARTESWWWRLKNLSMPARDWKKVAIGNICYHGKQLYIHKSVAHKSITLSYHCDHDLPSKINIKISCL